MHGKECSGGKHDGSATTPKVHNNGSDNGKNREIERGDVHGAAWIIERQ